MDFIDDDRHENTRTPVARPSSSTNSVLIQAVAWEETLNGSFRGMDGSTQDEGDPSAEQVSARRNSLNDESDGISSVHAATEPGRPSHDLHSPSISAISDDRDDGPDGAALDTIVDLDERGAKSDHAADTRNHWNPVWLNRASLFAFAALYGLLALALLLLWYFSTRYHGFPLLTTNHYAWTYGPTAVLVIVVSLWRQVDFWCKKLLPWQELKQGDARPDVSLTLDHVSPILPTVLYNAIRFRHVPVITTVMGHMWLKGITIASTGLLVFEATRMPATSVPLVASTAFEGRVRESWDPAPESVIDYQAYALLAYGLPYPDGVKSNVLYQSFNAGSTVNQTDNLISAEVDAFYPFFHCEEATVKAIGHYTFDGRIYDDGESFYANVSVQWPSCPETQHTPLQSLIWICDPDYAICPSKQLFGFAQTQNCPSDPDVFRQLLTMADVRFDQPEVEGATYRSEKRNDTDSWGIQIMPITALSCRAGYSIEKARVTYDHSQAPPAISVIGPLTQTKALLENYSISQFAEEYSSDFEVDPLMLGNEITNAMRFDYPDTFFGMMTTVANSNYEPFLQNSSKMAEAATTVFNHLAVQVALYYVTEQNVSIPLQGSISKIENRLHMTPLPLWLMVAGLVLMIMTTIAVAIRRPVDVITCNIDSIAGIALITAQSQGVQRLLKDAGRAGSTEIDSLLSTYTFRSSRTADPTKSGKFFVQVIPESGESFENPAKTQAQTSDQRWWVPIPLRLSVFLLISALPLSLIATLEILQKLSIHNNGLTNTQSSGDIATIIGTRIIPAFVMVGVATCYNAIDFSVSLLAPFHKLRQGRQAARTTIRSGLLGKTPLHALYLAVAHTHWAAVFASLAALIGSVLTIIVSGLYTVENTPGTREIVLQRTDTFSATWSDSVNDDGGSAALLSDLEALNTSYPAFTWSELAIPTVQLSSTSEALVKGGGSHQSPMTVTLPALRASLECSVMPFSDYKVTPSLGVLENGGDDGGNGLILYGTAPLPPNCQLGGITGNLSYIDWVAGTSELPYGITYGQWGQAMDLHVGPWDDDDNYYSFGEFNSTTQRSNPPGCPSLLFVFGSFNQSSDFYGGGTSTYYHTNASDFTPMVCTQLLTEVDTAVTFTLPNYTITSAEADESTIRYLNSGQNGERAFPYRPQIHWDLELHMWTAKAQAFDPWSFESPLAETYFLGQFGGLVDYFFAALLAGKHAVDYHSILGRENQDRLQDAVVGLYRRYMAQVISSKMRVASSESLETYTAKWQDPKSFRLKQNNTSKITLQAMLGTMFVFGVLAYLLCDTRTLLPHNPCSIAGTMSLLAGSELCDGAFAASLPEGAECMTQKEVRRQGIWEGRLFSMGWWEQSRFGIDLGLADKKLGWTRVWDDGWRLVLHDK